MYLWCRWEKLLPMVSFFLPLVLLPLVQFSNQKQEFLPMVHSCLWCCNTDLYVINWASSGVGPAHVKKLFIKEANRNGPDEPAVSREPSLFENKQRAGDLTPLDSSTCVFEGNLRSLFTWVDSIISVVVKSDTCTRIEDCTGTAAHTHCAGDSWTLACISSLCTCTTPGKL